MFNGTIKIPEINSGIYYLTILDNTNQTTFKLIKKITFGFSNNVYAIMLPIGQTAYTKL